ncbi:sigma-54 interaction domain-containing protein [Vibrio sp. RC27]
MDNNLFYRQAVEALTGSLNIEESLKNCINFLRDVIPADVLSVHLWDENLCSLRILATADKHHGHLCSIIIPVEQEMRHITRWEYGLGVKIINDFVDDPISSLVEDHMATIYGDEHYSHLISRVKIGDERICDLVLLAKGRGQFKPEHAQLFSTLDSPFGIAVSNSLKHIAIKDMHSKLLDEHEQLKSKYNQINHYDVIGSNSGLKRTIQKVDEVSNTDAPVLILGETGVGKDVIANMIQHNSSRKSQPYIRVNCGAIPESLVDSELFGHEKGAFTGASEQKIGRFERANKGTIFLDEVGELSKAAQVRLLRVLQNGEIERVGGKKTLKLDIRVIAATNRSLEDMVASNEFRPDLYYRLCLFPIKIPPLRERLEDIPLFANYFIQQCRKKFNLPPSEVAIGEIEKLQSHSWPGNIRELTNVIERSVIAAHGRPIIFNLNRHSDVVDFAPAVNINPNTAMLTLEEINREHIKRALAVANGKIQGPDGAAQLLNINPHTLRSRIKKLGISYNE